MEDKVVSKIYSTTDYSKFDIFSYNRKPSLRRTLVESIQSKGQLQPITVNSKFEIIDGQHRFIALQKLDLPILYFISDTKEEDDVVVRTMNSTSVNWNPVNYLNSFCSQGKKFYQEFRQMMRDVGLSPNCTYKILKGKELGKADLDAFKNGNFVITPSERARFETVLPMFKTLISFDRYSKKTFSRTKVVEGAVEAFLNPKFKFEKLVKIVQTNSASIYDQARDRSRPESFRDFLYVKVGMSINH